jgi:hypothetical protein
MSFIYQQTYSREYLVNLPIKIRKELVAQFCEGLLRKVVEDATAGKSSSILSIPTTNIHGHSIVRMGQSPLTKEEVLEFLQEKFPDCKIYYDEKWISSAPDKQELKKGITVEWA